MGVVSSRTPQGTGPLTPKAEIKKMELKTPLPAMMLDTQLDLDEEELQEMMEQDLLDETLEDTSRSAEQRKNITLLVIFVKEERLCMSTQDWMLWACSDD